MGIASLKLFDREDIGLLDPTLGDWGCQLRALWLIDFANKYKTFKATHSGELTREKLLPGGENALIAAEELEMLGMYRLGTLFTTHEVDGLGMPKMIRTSPRATTAEENAGGWKLGSKSENKRVLNYTKNMLGDAVNESPIEALKKSNL
jgi:hypothetical protein